MSKRFRIDFKNLDIVKVFYGIIFIGLFVVIITLSFRGPGPITGILIESDADWSNYNFDGEGTADSPYIITEYVFDIDQTYGIKIINTTKSFYIQSCNISNTDVAIYIENVTAEKMLIQNVYLYNNSVGIDVSKAGNFTINNSRFHTNAGYAIKLGLTATNISVYYNDFVSNTPGAGLSQTLDNGSLNLWYNNVTTLGNYWFDIGLNPTYSINGTANSFDLYPKATPFF